MNLRKIIVSNDNTHHLFNEKPLYAKKFKHVLKFHPPGLAPVLDEHIIKDISKLSVFILKKLQLLQIKVGGILT